MIEVSVVPSPSCDLIATVRTLLHNSGYSDLRAVDVKASPRGVQLQGTVRSYYLKQVAQGLALSTDGVDAVDNQMEVA
jgi:osmotically-inducible protein OsmY